MVAECIEELYAVFQGYHLEGSTYPCPCCRTEEDDKLLLAKPLRQLTTEDLLKYAFDALYTWGGEAEFKHFLPRLFELLWHAQCNGSVFVDAESLIGRLRYGNWHTWPSTEQEAIRAFLRASWQEMLQLRSEPGLSWHGPFRWLEAIAQAEDDLSWYLAEWEATSSSGAVVELARVILHVPIFASRPTSPYMQERKAQWDEIRGWLQSPAVRAKLEREYLARSSEPYAEELFEAASLLQHRSG